MKKDGIFQPNAVCEATLLNNPALSVRSLLLKNKDGFGLPFDQYLDAVNGFCLSFRELIMNSPNVSEKDMVFEKPPQIVVHVNQNVNADMLLVIVQNLEGGIINDPLLCESLHKWAMSVSKGADA